MKFKFSRIMLLAVGMMTAFGAMAQMEQPMPVDDQVRIGKLPNGLTYYIRHNEKPKGQADFYIAQKVGSILEDENQRGLAHFLEHMCFNGTENFPGNTLVQWLESIGVKFGANLNAYTAVDQTVYNIANVPVGRESVQDSVLLILHDWADGLLLDPVEIDKERGVIHQEWRTTNVGQQRILENLLPTIYPDSKYAYRMPIGTIEVIDNFPPQAIRDYYEKWYRPDQQGIVVVGDIDVDRIEGKIKELFSPIKMPENPAPREYFPVPETQGTIVAIGSDAEQTMPLMMMAFKTDAMPDSLNNTIGAFLTDYFNSMLVSMLNNRLSEMMAQPDAPFSLAQASYGEFLLAKTKDALDLTVIAKGNDPVPSLQAAYRELLRAVRGGFTASEYDRARSEYMSRLEKRYNDRDNLESDYYVQQYINNFLDNKYMSSPEQVYQIMSMMSQMLPVDAVNQIIKEYVTDNNRVVVMMLPEDGKTIIPTNDQVTQALAAIDAENIEAYVDQMKDEPLVPVGVVPGKITSVKNDDKWGAQVWTLSNGATVIVKPTTFKNDEILFGAFAKGGMSVLSDDMANSIVALPYMTSQHGLGTYTYSDLQKYLQGKQVGCEFELNAYTRNLSGHTTPRDLPTLMELIYMTFTDFQITEDEFNATKQLFSNMLGNQQSAPQYVFMKYIQEQLMASPKVRQITSDIIEAADRDQTLAIVRGAVANAADYTFVFVGNVDVEALRPMVEQYIASIPGNPATAVTSVEWNPAIEFAAGRGDHRTSMKMQTPQAWTMVVVEAEVPYNMQNQKLGSIVPQILSKRLLETVREDEGAVYSIQAVGGMRKDGKYPMVIQIPFPLDPDKTDLVLGMVEKEIKNMAENISDSELNAVKEYLVKSYTEGKEQNGPWLNAILSAEQTGEDVFNGNIEAVNAITPQQVQQFVADMLKQGNYQVVVLTPEQ